MLDFITSLINYIFFKYFSFLWPNQKKKQKKAVLLVFIYFSSLFLSFLLCFFSPFHLLFFFCVSLSNTNARLAKKKRKKTKIYFAETIITIIHRYLLLLQSFASPEILIFKFKYIFSHLVTHITFDFFDFYF